MKREVSLIILLIAIVAVGYIVYNKQETKEDSLILSQTTEVKSAETEVKSEEEKTREFVKEAVIEGLDRGEEFIDKKKIKDSIKFANRKKFYVYQIGMPKGSPEELSEVYKKIENLGNVCFLKASRNSYYLIKQGADTEEQLVKNKESEGESLKSEGVEDAIKVVEISSLCLDSEEAIMGKSVKVNKRKVTCYVCK